MHFNGLTCKSCRGRIHWPRPLFRPLGKKINSCWLKGSDARLCSHWVKIFEMVPNGHLKSLQAPEGFLLGPRSSWNDFRLVFRSWYTLLISSFLNFAIPGFKHETNDKNNKILFFFIKIFIVLDLGSYGFYVLV